MIGKNPVLGSESWELCSDIWRLKGPKEVIENGAGLAVPRNNETIDWAVYSLKREIEGEMFIEWKQKEVILLLESKRVFQEKSEELGRTVKKKKKKASNKTDPFIVIL